MLLLVLPCPCMEHRDTEQHFLLCQVWQIVRLVNNSLRLTLPGKVQVLTMLLI